MREILPKIVVLLPGFLYVTMSVMIGEHHPFSRFNMYDSFPEVAYSLRCTRMNGSALGLADYSTLRTADLLHTLHAGLKEYNETFERDSFPKTKAHLRKVIREAYILPADTTMFHLVVISYGEGKISIEEKELFTLP